MIGRVAGLLALLGLAACLSDFDVWVVEEPPRPPEPRVPAPLQAEAAPQLVPTDHAGLLRAHVGAVELFYHEPEGLWYRRDGGLWFQAFRWDGYWFPPARLPQQLGVDETPSSRVR